MVGVRGIHHVTAIAGDPQQNLGFYAGVLGMRLVKRSVNQDDPFTYHLFFADADGHPGTDLTFFPSPALPPGAPGVGQIVEVALAVPPGSLPFWQERLQRASVELAGPQSRFGEAALAFRDPHGLPVCLVESESALRRPFTPWQRGPVPAERQVRGLHSVRLWVRRLAPSVELLQHALGFRPAGEEDGWHRLAVEDGGSGCLVDLKELPAHRPGWWGAGSIHHVAWRVADEAEQQAVRAQAEQAGCRPTPVVDRFWFRSVYFREPGGVLYELATDGPGFATDEPVERLGERLVLPPWLEARRQAIERALPPLRLPRWS
ncbi:MAG TPA: ring-cleaving dioxygenase [Limnochordales bacterium]